MLQLTKEVNQHLYMRKPMEYGHNILYHNTNATMSDREKIMVKSESIVHQLQSHMSSSCDKVYVV